ncbi:DUF4337 domain-containing protein [uncultured Caulobacter sp.]|uniref:DUF4337 domain-containing protein n=1 Tax=uncultured Caulobacter sp. TaxID=158749 RepID=UPI0026384A5B|nr:DUF4337 domain-containing protein [uncultured Caulobacter sp.]
MDIEISAEAKSKSLNRMVAITVVVLSVFLGIMKIKDDNLVQAMQQAKADAVDTWGEYQATKTKLHITEGTIDEMTLLRGMARPAEASVFGARLTALRAQADKYRAEIPALADKARGFEKRYDDLNYHDDQFDMCDALVSIAVSTAAVAALTESAAVLYVSWAFGGLGLLMGLSGFFGWMIHPDAISRLLS